MQLRVGGQAARFQDETIPPRFGCIGQETTGPGGFAKALRTVPVVLELAEETARRGAPGAWFVDFTNPTGLVTQALLDEGHRALGLCNVAIGFQRRFAKEFGVEPEQVQLEHVGLNHLTWERKVLVDGVDRLPEILDTRDRPGGGRNRHAGGADPSGGSDPLLLPALLLPDEARPRAPAHGEDAGRRGHGDRGGADRAVQGSDARHQAEAAGGARRRLLQRRGRGARRVAARRHR